MRRSVDFRMQEKQLLDKILGPKVYDRRIRPGSPGNLTQGIVFLFQNSLEMAKFSKWRWNLSKTGCAVYNIHSGYLILALLGFQFLDFRLKPFVDPMPVEL